MNKASLDHIFLHCIDAILPVLLPKVSGCEGLTKNGSIKSRIPNPSSYAAGMYGITGIIKLCNCQLIIFVIENHLPNI